MNALSALRSFLLRPANVALASTFLHFQWARVRRKCAVCAPEAVSVRCRSWLASWGENYVESLARGVRAIAFNLRSNSTIRSNHSR